MGSFGDFILDFWKANPPPTSLSEEFIRRWEINKELDAYDRETMSDLALGGSYNAIVELGKPYLLVKKNGEQVWLYCFAKDGGDGQSFDELYIGLGPSISNYREYNELIKMDNMEVSMFLLNDVKMRGMRSGKPRYWSVFRDYDVYEFTTQNLNIFLNWSNSPWVGK